MSPRNRDAWVEALDRRAEDIRVRAVWNARRRFWFDWDSRTVNQLRAVRLQDCGLTRPVLGDEK